MKFRLRQIVRTGDVSAKNDFAGGYTFAERAKSLMEGRRRADGVIKASAKGWGCVWGLFLLAGGINAYRGPQSHTGWNIDQVSILCFEVAATALVTGVATLCLAVPYVFWVTPEVLEQHSWRMYVETTILAIVGTLLLTFIVRPQAEPFRSTFFPLAIFAVSVSIAGSFFYLRDSKSETETSELNEQSSGGLKRP